MKSFWVFHLGTTRTSHNNSEKVQQKVLWAVRVATSGPGAADEAERSSHTSWAKVHNTWWFLQASSVLVQTHKSGIIPQIQPENDVLSERGENLMILEN